ncbi:phosphotransferase, partial [Gammaproteobacteria bacterium]|nr:phosphotransferase [Gammaproteobacteria bacterium]
MKVLPRILTAQRKKIRQVSVNWLAISPPSFCPCAEYPYHTGLDLDLDLDLSLVTRVWEYSMHKAQSHQRRETAWFHADLVAENLLVNGDGLTGVLDFGSLGVGDPTVDLHGAWEVLGPDSRAYFRELMDVSDDEWTAGRTWALAIAIGAIAYYWDSMPARARQRIDM